MEVIDKVFWDGSCWLAKKALNQQLIKLMSIIHDCFFSMEEVFSFTILIESRIRNRWNTTTENACVAAMNVSYTQMNWKQLNLHVCVSEPILQD